MSVELKISENMGVLILNNPPYHALTIELLEELCLKFKEASENSATKALVITAAPGMFFSAGADVRMIQEVINKNNPEELRALLTRLHEILLEIDDSSKPILAAIDGVCFGGGLELALACNYIIASPKSMFAFPEVTLGIIPGLGGTQRFRKVVGLDTAFTYIVSGKRFDAQEAFNIRLLDSIIEGDFIAGVKLFANKVVTGSVKNKLYLIPRDKDARMFRLRKELSIIARGMPKTTVELAASALFLGAEKTNISEALKVEMGFVEECFQTPEAKEGIAAFLEKRKPNFKYVIGENTTPEKVTTTAKILEILPWQRDEFMELRSTIRKFGEKEIAPLIPKMETDGIIDKNLMKKMASLGLFGVSFAEKYGGAGLGEIGAGVVMEEITFWHPSTAVMIGAHVGLALEAINLFGSDTQKERYMVVGIAGEKIGAYATTEPEVGSDIAAIKTRAKKVAGGWTISGSKQFISNGELADFIIVFAQTDPNGGQKTLAAFIVDTKSPGFAITKREKKIGLHASCTNSFSLDEVFVPDENLLGKVGQGFKIAMNTFNHSRALLGAGCIGAIRAALAYAIEFVRTRKAFGKNLFEIPKIQENLAKIEVMRATLEPLVYQTLWHADEGKSIIKEASIVKYLASEYAWEAADLALQIHGGSGYIEDYPIARLWRDIRVDRIFEGTSEIQLLMVFKELFKEKF